MRRATSVRVCCRTFIVTRRASISLPTDTRFNDFGGAVRHLLSTYTTLLEQRKGQKLLNLASIPTGTH